MNNKLLKFTKTAIDRLRFLDKNTSPFIGFTIQLLLWFILLCVLFPFMGKIFLWVFKTDLALSDFILFITAAFLVASTFETQKMRKQMEESDLRPIILRSGFIGKWEDLKYSFREDHLISGNLLEFKVLQGIATDIYGYVFKDGKRYKLFFVHDMTRISENGFSASEKWGWLEAGAILFGFFKDTDFTPTLEDNGIIIYFKNIQGRRYYTIEDKLFSQTSFRE